MMKQGTPSYRSLWLLPAVILLSVPCLGTTPGVVIDQQNLAVGLLLPEKELVGQAEMVIRFAAVPEVCFLLAPQARISSVTVNQVDAKYSFKSGRLVIPAAALPPAQPCTVKISYQVVFADAIPEEPVSFDNPGFGVTGTIAEQGVFLLPGSGWIPQVPGTRPRIKLTVTAPRGIYAVTAGKLIQHSDQGQKSVSTWDIDNPLEGLALSAGPYVMRSLLAGTVPVMTYLFPQSADLAGTYLNAAQAHLGFYQSLHGPYPFPKFAIVENFFPTGYGFPSYTLLGTTVLNLPFIPDTSLKHEIAHSWWGNGVLVDYDGGNWCEGLTTYVADYLSQEMAASGDGKRYRQQILQDYATLVAAGGDLPLRRFLSRVDPATRAVGYGKAALVFHMVRRQLGDDLFWRALRDIFKERLFIKTSWDDFRRLFVATGRWEESAARQFFEQWLNRTGAPILELHAVRSVKDETGWRVEGLLLQSSPHYELEVPLRLETAAGDHDQTVRLNEHSASFAFHADQAPRRLIVDPESHLFRLLYPEEIPATVNSVKGARDLVAVFSSALPAAHRGTAELLLTSLNQDPRRLVREDQVDPASLGSGSVLFYGWPRSERLRALLAARPEGLVLDSDRFALPGVFSSKGADCLFAAFGDPLQPGKLVALFLPTTGSGETSAAAAARKLTHYGKYSYLTFSQGVNQTKGTWTTSRSPLIVDFKEQP
jgi:hypothetical protein